MLSHLILSCGKKPEVNPGERQKKNLASTEELNFKSLKEIRLALEENNLTKIQQAIAKNPGVNLNHLIPDSGETYLIIAIRRDFRTLRNFLIENGSDLNLANVHKETPLITAILNDRLNSAKVLLEKKVDTERRDQNGDTALHIALKRSNDEMALTLIKHDANINTLDLKGRSALSLADENNTPESFKLIKHMLKIEMGTPDLPDFLSVLLAADLEGLERMIKRYPNIPLEKSYQSINPLVLLLDVQNEKDAYKMAQFLIQNQVDINGPENAEMTPLIKAIITRKKDFTDLYLSSLANPQLVDKDGKSALIHAVELNDPDVVKNLLSFSALRSYSFKKDGKEVTHKSCNVARQVGRKLTTEVARAANKKIRDLLNCHFMRWSL